MHVSFPVLLLAQAHRDRVVCFSETRCIGDDLGVWSPRNCCINDNPNGLSYRAPGTETCVGCGGKYIATEHACMSLHL